MKRLDYRVRKKLKKLGMVFCLLILWKCWNLAALPDTPLSICVNLAIAVASGGLLVQLLKSEPSEQEENEEQER